uniref:Envelope glycoprotein gL n=1 Tax=Macaca mulatta rhadinovirus TaxID=703611 RepID=D2XQL0_9GAMA|nr:envelope glycoprotein gL [Macaca mulatta rhadinovirus]
MRSMYTLSLFITCGFFLITCCTGLVVNPCCKIIPLSDFIFPEPFEIASFHLTNLALCPGLCTATLRYKADRSTTEICVNGFHLRAFFIRILYKLNYSVPREELQLLNYMQYSLDEFLAEFEDFHINGSESGTAYTRPPLLDFSDRSTKVSRIRKVITRRGDLRRVGLKQ